MNKLLLMTTLATLTSVAISSTRVSTPLWSAPLADTISIKVETKGHQLLSTCRQLETHTYNRKGELGRWVSADSFNFRRNLPLPSASFGTEYFTEEFILSEVEDHGRIFKFKESEPLNRNESLPHYHQNSATTIVPLLDYSKIVIAVANEDKSLYLASQKLGLEASKVEITRSQQGVVLRFSGKDIVCDFIKGKIKLAAEAERYVKITDNAFKSLSTFYKDEVSPIIDKTLKMEGSDQMKAALFGYRMGALLESQTKSSEKSVEAGLSLTMMKFFESKTLKPTNLIKKVNQNYEVHVHRVIKASHVNVALESEI